MLFFISTFSYWASNEYFELSMQESFTWWAKINVKVKNIDDLVNLNMFISDKSLIKWGSDGNNFTFIIPSNLKINTLNKHISFKAKLKWWKEQDYIFNYFFPEFNWIDLTDLTWWKQIHIYWNLTGSCKLVLSDGKTWTLYVKDNWYYVNIPKKIENDIKWWYINCDWLSSKYKQFFISKSPILNYLITKDKQRIKLWDTLILVWENIKLSSNDDIKLFLNWEELKYKLLSNNELEFTLPYRNFDNAKILLTRNDFESNEITFSVNMYSFIKNIVILNKNNKQFFRLYGNFDFKLWNLEVYFWNKKVNVLWTWTIHNKNYIDVEYPSLIPNDNWFSCSYYLEPNYFFVKLWWKQSNKYFYTPNTDISITYIEKPSCDKWDCYIKAYLNKNSWKFKVLISWQEKTYYSLANMIKIQTDEDLIKKGDIQIITTNCIKWPKYYFDFENDFKPVISYIESKDKFISNTKFTIYWDYLTSDGSSKPLNTKVSFNPNVVDDISIWYNIKWIIKYWIENWQKINVKLSTRHGDSNWVSFIIWWKWKYYGNPVIENVLYPDGWEWWKQAKIVWVWFSSNCNENKIFFDSKVVYPDECNYNYLIFTIPEDLETDKLLIEVSWNKSPEYKLNTKIWWNILEKKLYITNSSVSKALNFSKDKLYQEISFNIQNTLTDIYISSLKFIIQDVDFLPVWDFVLEINWNDKKTIWSYIQHKILFTQDKNIWYVQRIKNWYEVIFKWVYIPFSTENIEAKLKFTFTKAIKNDSIIKINFPKQKVYYNNVFWEQKVNSLNLDKEFTITYKIINQENICFDSDTTYKHCALVLKLKDQEAKKEIDNKKASNEVITQKEKSQNTTNEKQEKTQKSLSKEEKIAKKLTLEKMKLLNNVLKDFIIKMKRKYGKNKEKLRLIVEMYRWYKQMIQNTSDDYNSKTEYVKWLIYFAQNYFTFMRG